MSTRTRGDGLQPNSKRNLLAMASNLVAMAGSVCKRGPRDARDFLFALRKRGERVEPHHDRPKADEAKGW